LRRKDKLRPKTKEEEAHWNLDIEAARAIYAVYQRENFLLLARYSMACPRLQVSNNKYQLLKEMENFKNKEM
jgi:hypothetical protein